MPSSPPSLAPAKLTPATAPRARALPRRPLRHVRRRNHNLRPADGGLRRHLQQWSRLPSAGRGIPGANGGFRLRDGELRRRGGQGARAVLGNAALRRAFTWRWAAWLRCAVFRFEITQQEAPLADSSLARPPGLPQWECCLRFSVPYVSSRFVIVSRAAEPGRIETLSGLFTADVLNARSPWPPLCLSALCVFSTCEDVFVSATRRVSPSLVPPRLCRR